MSSAPTGVLFFSLVYFFVSVFLYSCIIFIKTQLLKKHKNITQKSFQPKFLRFSNYVIKLLYQYHSNII